MSLQIEADINPYIHISYQRHFSVRVAFELYCEMIIKAQIFYIFVS